jgi:hypothetical protein
VSGGERKRLMKEKKIEKNFKNLFLKEYNVMLEILCRPRNRDIYIVSTKMFLRSGVTL